LVAGAVLLVWLLQPILGTDVPLTLFVLAVAASAWIGGVGPGLFATLASVVAAHVLSVKPHALVPITAAGYSLRLLLFAITGIAISVISETRRRAAARAIDAAARAERKGAELVQSQARFRRIVETAQEGIWHVDASGTTVYANQHLADMLGFQTEELVGRSAFELIPEEDVARARAAWSRRLGGEQERTEFRFRRKDGGLVWLLAAASPLIEDGVFVGAFAMLTDVTETRRGEEALKAGEARKETLLAVPEILARATSVERSFGKILETTCRGLGWCFGALWRVDREANVLRAWISGRSRPPPPVRSPAGLPLAGLGLPGRVWTSLEGSGSSTRRTRTPAQGGIESGLAAGSRSRSRSPRASGARVPSASREPDPELLGGFLGVGSQMGQFMERIRIENEREILLESEKAARRDAESANRAKDEVLATLSHELRTPLNAIVGWAHLLKTGQLDEGQRARAVDVIDRNAKAQSQIVADVLDVSRIVMGKLRLDVRPVTLATVVEEALDTLRPAAAAKEIQMEASLAGEERVSGDPDRLQQVVWNLISNAIKFTPSGGSVRVRLRRADGHVDVVVEDTGAGIRPDFLPHVFERFRQSDSSSTRAHGGLGLGLALVRHLVELHGGTVSAESRGQGHGATFTVRLPLMLAEARDRAEAPDVDLQGLRVLVVDDDGEARERVAAALRHVGAQVRTAANVMEALADVDRHPPSVIVSDLEMAGGDGYQFIRRLRALAPEQGGTIPAAALTAHAQPDEVRRALEAGFQRHLTKPSADEITRAVAAWRDREGEQGQRPWAARCAAAVARGLATTRMAGITDRCSPSARRARAAPNSRPRTPAA
jgi:PAS domain S-box-containing protein